jgi:hypothetical protein
MRIQRCAEARRSQTIRLIEGSFAVQRNRGFDGPLVEPLHGFAGVE